jgi:hypothetical protein
VQLLPFAAGFFESELQHGFDWFLLNEA